MNDEYNYDLTVEQAPQYQLQVDNDTDYAMELQEAINIIRYLNVHYDTTAAWNLQPTLIAQRGEIYVYSDKATLYDQVGNPTFVPGVKVGDGTSYLIDMPFVGDEIIFALAQHINNSTVHITQAERIFWNNKVSSFLDEQDDETLVLSKTTYTED